jgi:3-phenylpropionate/trans-cinnamate dioxygenase ferredoxin subunit
MLEERLCSINDIKPGESRRFDFGKTPICLVRIDDDYYAIGDTCSHAKISLSEGEVHADSLEVECWKHGSCFSLIDGTPNTLPATQPVPVYEVRIDGDDVLVVIS